jgi:hypothetical protein
MDMGMMDSTTSPLFGDLLGQGGGMDPETLRTIAALKALLAGGGMGGQQGGGQTFINPLTQADALSTIRARDNQTNPIMGPQSNGIKFLFPGGRVAPGGPNPGGDQMYKQAAQSALITNLLSGLGQNLPAIMGAMRQRGQGPQGGTGY